jgi:VanZ like protein
MGRVPNSVNRALSGRSGILAAIAVILVVTLWPERPAVAPAFNWCIGCGELGALDVLNNIALFVPLGVVLRLRGSSLARALIVSAALSTAIEILQLVIVPGRDPSLSDIVANSLGGALGRSVARVPALIREGSRAAWRAVAWSWVALTLGVLAFGTWAVAAGVPWGDYIVQWQPVRSSYSTFAGELLAFAANGVDLPAAARIRAAQLPAFSKGDFDVTARLTPGPRRDGISLISRVVLEYGEFLMLGRQQDALVVRYLANATSVGSRSPIYALPSAFRGDQHDTIEVRAIKHGDSLELRATRRGSPPVRAARHIRITTARMWATLLPFNRGFGDLGVLGDVLWLALLVAPAAYAATRAYVGAWRFVPLAAQGAGLILTGSLLQASLWWWPTWVAVVIGALVGYSLGGRTRYHHPPSS